MQKKNDPRAEISGLYLCPSLGLQTTCLQYLISYSEHSIIWRTSNQAPERTSREAGQGERSSFKCTVVSHCLQEDLQQPRQLVICHHLLTSCGGGLPPFLIRNKFIPFPTCPQLLCH